MDITKVKNREAVARATKNVDVDFDEDGKPFGFIIVSKNSKEYRDKASEVRANAIRRQTNRRTRIDRTTEEGAIKLDEVIQENEHELAVAVTVGFYGFTEPDGEGKQVDVPFSQELVNELYTTVPVWREKVTAALEDDTGFLPN